jgi:glycosyltransferase involved in cell wall biosynthesis
MLRISTRIFAPDASSLMTTMLLVSRYCAYDKACYAGSQIHNYYLKRLSRDFEIKVLTVASPSDAPHLDFDKYGIDAEIVFVDESPRRLALFLLFNWRNIFNYFGKTIGVVNGYVHRLLLKHLKKLSNQGFQPDCILLEWTQVALMVNRIKKLYPNAKYIAVEHDIAFQKYQRMYEASRGAVAIKEGLRYRSLQKAELTALRQIDLIVTLSQKDKAILVDHGLTSEAIHPIIPYFSSYKDVRYNSESSVILFFGAMDRPENYLSIAWFIEAVYQTHLSDFYSLCIVGAHPHQSLEKYRSEKISITGYVQDIRPYLAGSMCKVAPIIRGAGIKIKVIEAMSAGLPVIGNAIAIEGIPAQDGVHYLHAEKPEEYVRLFDAIRIGRIDLRALSGNAKKFIADTFDIDKSYNNYKKAIDVLTRRDFTLRKNECQEFKSSYPSQS